MKKTLFALTLLASFTTNAQIKLTVVNPVTKGVTIKNFGSTQVDISTYRLCSILEYKTLNQAPATIISGDFILSPGEEVSVKWPASTGFNTVSSDLALYLPTGNFTDAPSMVAYMEYNAGMQGREDVAVTAGFWQTNTFVTGTGPFYYTGNGTQSGAEFWSTEFPGGNQQVVINELDCDEPGTDTGEFIELFGVPNTPLDGLVLVLINGAPITGNVSYKSYSLNGYSLDINGFFVAGNSAVPGVSLIFPNNTIENGADGVAIYQGSPANWPNGTSPTTNDLVDALVYDTDDADDTDLLAILTPGKPQMNEGAANNTNSLSRLPDGGAPFESSLYVAQAPTPNETNVVPIQCQGATISTVDLETSVALCSDGVMVPINFVNTSAAPLLVPYVYVITNSANLIIAIDTDGTIDFSTLPNGEIHVWGLSYTGTLDPSTTTPGLAASSIISDECFSLSTNFVTVTKNPCIPSPCDGGTILSNDGSSYLTFCIDGFTDPASFTHTPETPLANYNYVVTNAAGEIVVVSTGTVDFDLLPAGVYSVWGLSFEGTLDVSTIEPGDLASAITTSGSCIQLSSNFISVITQTCSVVQGCTELFISEYLEGTTGTNKAIEIYNPTNFTVNLSDYALKLYVNGAAAFTNILPLTGTLAPGAVHVVVSPSADQALIDISNQSGQVANFNGDDAIELLHSDVVIDVIGVVGVDPGVSWSVASGSTKDFSLVRKPSVTSPTTNWIYSTGQWDVYPGSDWTHLGSHLASSCSAIPQIGFTTTVIQIDEDAGDLTISVQAFNIPSALAVTVNVSSGDATAGFDYSNVFPVILNFPQGTSIQTFVLPIIDDILEENNEYFMLDLNGNTPIEWVQESLNIIINHNDQSYPLYDIEEISSNDLVTGVLDSAEVFCELRGIVHGINFNPSGLHFHLIDATDGIKVFSATENYGYTVHEGDSISVRGQLIQFMGQTEIRPDFITAFDGGHQLSVTNAVSVLGESNESHLTTLRCVALVDPSEWTNDGNGFEIRVTDGTNINKVRIDADTDLFGGPVPEGHFTLTGLVEQADDTSPFTSEYTLWMRYAEDFTENVIASFASINPLQYDDLGANVTFNNSSTGAETYDWDFGDGDSSGEEDPAHLYEYGWLVDNESFTISLTAINDMNCADTYAVSVDAVYVGIPELSVIPVEIFPNPFSDIVSLISPYPIRSYQCVDQTGKVVSASLGLNTTRISTDLSFLSSGIYMLQINTDKGPSFHRIIRN